MPSSGSERTAVRSSTRADDFFGHAVNYAARMTSAATGGEILTSSLVNELVSQTGEFEFEQPRDVQIKASRDLSGSIRSPGASSLHRERTWSSSIEVRSEDGLEPYAHHPSSGVTSASPMDKGVGCSP